jgi:acyl-CoA thioesterase
MSGVAVSVFDERTAVTGGRADVDPALSGFGAAHGGYVAALALRGLSDTVGEEHRTPRSLTVQLLARVAPGALDVDAVVERAGGSTTSTSARLRQQAATVGTAVATFGRARPSLVRTDAAMPPVPPPEACAPLADVPVPEAGAAVLVEHRPAAPPLPLSGSDRAELLVWMRLADDRPVDAASAVFLADSAAPALYGALDAYVPIPSVEIAVHFAPAVAHDNGPWVLAVLRNRFAAEGYAVEDGELWTPGGRLLLVSRQLRRVLRTDRQ